jgi:prepilin-type N-terminal cleavage/methylation domain-containing protein
MLNRTKKLTSDGFTIIEVVIVLAIAALILLIVLLAVPALQRNSRNTTIKNDASAIASGISDFESNNSGQSPTKLASFNSGNIVFANDDIENGATAKIQDSDTVNGQETGSTNIQFADDHPGTADASAGALFVVHGHTCPDNDGNYTDSTRAFSIYYWTETPGIKAGIVKGLPNALGLKGQCLDT